MTDWAPINTAPKNGSFILAYWPENPAMANESWTVIKTWWGGIGWESAYEGAPDGDPMAPTHWMPLPEKPEATQ